MIVEIYNKDYNGFKIKNDPLSKTFILDDSLINVKDCLNYNVFDYNVLTTSINKISDYKKSCIILKITKQIIDIAENEFKLTVNQLIKYDNMKIKYNQIKDQIQKLSNIPFDNLKITINNDQIDICQNDGQNIFFNEDFKIINNIRKNLLDSYYKLLNEYLYKQSVEMYRFLKNTTKV